MINNPMTDLTGVTFTTGDLFTVTRSGESISYYKDGKPLPFTTMLPANTGPLFVYAFFAGGMPGMGGTQITQAVISGELQ